MDWITVARKVLPYALAFVAGVLIAAYVQQMRIKGYQADIKVARSDLKTCQDANASQEATIGSLRQEVKDALKGCDDRLKIKDRTLSKNKKIDTLKTGTKDVKPGAIKITPEGTNEKNGNNSTGDELLDWLNRMYPADGAGGENGIHPAAGPVPSAGT